MNDDRPRRSIRLRPALLEDLAEAIAWYESRVEGLGSHFSDQFFEAVSRASEEPESRRVVFDGCRRIRLLKFPYSIYYLIENEEIVFILLFHSAREPRKLDVVLRSRSR